MRSPMRISPPEMFSSPAIMRKSVDFPQPDGPTRMTNSPSSMSIETPWMTCVAPKALRTSSISTDAIALLREPMPLSSQQVASPLHRTGGQPSDDVLLRSEEHDDRRKDRQRNEGQDEVPVGRILALVHHDPERQRVQLVAIENHEREQIVVPAVDEDNHGD